VLHATNDRAGDGRADESRRVRPRVLFLCTGNSCRSQIAEGWARALKGDVMDALSAGTHPVGVNPLAVKVMAEAGVDISRQTSKHIDALRGERFDLVITVCDSAREACPAFPGATQTLHVGFEDPPKLAAAARSEAEALPLYRRVRDEIRAFVELLPGAFGRDTPGDSKTHTENLQ
jgi:arsenate reductase